MGDNAVGRQPGDFKDMELLSRRGCLKQAIASTALGLCVNLVSEWTSERGAGDRD